MYKHFEAILKGHKPSHDAGCHRNMFQLWHNLVKIVPHKIMYKFFKYFGEKFKFRNVLENKTNKISNIAK